MPLGVQDTPPLWEHATTGYHAEELKYPFRWRTLRPTVGEESWTHFDTPPTPRMVARFPKSSQARWVDSNDTYAEREMAYTDIEVKQRFHRKIGLQLPHHVYPDYYMKHLPPDPMGDIQHKKQIADTMLRAYFNSGEGRGLNIEMPHGSFFDESRIETVPDNYNMSQKYALTRSNDYFSDFRRPFEVEETRPKSKSFVQRMEYDPQRGRIEIDIETVDYSYSDYPFMANPADPEAVIKQVRETLKSKLTIIVKSRANPIKNVPENEQVAIETLREMITEAEFRKYIKDGFILVRGRSGRVYQIFRDRHHTKVWEKGKLVEEVCVRIDSKANVPPTDNVIAFRTAIMCSEDEFRKLGNVYKMRQAA